MSLGWEWTSVAVVVAVTWPALAALVIALTVGTDSRRNAGGSGEAAASSESPAVRRGKDRRQNAALPCVRRGGFSGGESPRPEPGDAAAPLLASDVRGWWRA